MLPALRRAERTRVMTEDDLTCLAAEHVKQSPLICTALM